eukprot:COSAG01_NODE_1196_length_11303_cov_16.500714_9_plen_169_part_00
MRGQFQSDAQCHIALLSRMPHTSQGKLGRSTRLQSYLEWNLHPVTPLAKGVTGWLMLLPLSPGLPPLCCRVVAAVPPLLPRLLPPLLPLLLPPLLLLLLQLLPLAQVAFTTRTTAMAATTDLRRRCGCSQTARRKLLLLLLLLVKVTVDNGSVTSVKVSNGGKQTVFY